MNDIYVILKRPNIEEIYKIISSIFKNINFTMNSEKDEQLALMDVLV